MGLLLDHEPLVSGPRQVEVKVRPRRAVFLIDPLNPDAALRAIAAVCQEWGGMFHLLVPCAPGDQPSDRWLNILDGFDPEWIADCVDASEAFLESAKQRLRCHVYRCDLEADELEIPGASVFSPLRPYVATAPVGQRDVAVILDGLEGHGLSLPLAFRFGNAERRTVRFGEWLYFLMPRGLGNLQSPASATDRRNPDFGEFLDVARLDVRGLSVDQLREIAVVPPIDLSPYMPTEWGVLTRYRTLPRLTALNLEPEELAGDPEWKRRNWHDMQMLMGDPCLETGIARVVVVGEADSVEDLCLAWALRAQRHPARWMPIWVTPDWLREPGFLERLIGIGQMERLEPFERSIVGPAALHLVSASMSTGALASCLDVGLLHSQDDLEVDRFCLHGAEDIDRLFESGVSTGTWDREVAVFSDGVADCRTGSYDLLGTFIYPEQLVSVRRIDRYAVPRWMFSMESHAPGSSGTRYVRLGSDGQTETITAERQPSGEHLPLNALSGWTAARVIADRGGYAIEPSDKGRIGVGVVELLGDAFGLGVLASSRVFDLLEAMSVINRSKAVREAKKSGGDPVERQLEGGQFDRQFWDFGRIRRQCGLENDDAKLLVRWLVDRGVLYRGDVFTCRRCQMKRWYPAARLFEEQTCDGCQLRSRTLVDVERTTWTYRVNELIAHASEQGVLVHLVTAAKLREMSPEFAGFYPGVNLLPGENTPGGQKELDVLAILRGDAIVVECKSSIRGFDDDEIDKLIALGQRLGAEIAVFATTDSRSEFPESMKRFAGVRGFPEVVGWNRSRILDPGLEEELWSEAWPDAYLRGIVEKIRLREGAQRF